MKTFFWLLVCAMVGVGAFFAEPLPAQQKSEKGIEDTWQGALDVPGMKLRLVVKITKKPDGALAGTLDSIDQGAKDIPLSAVTFKNKKLRLELKAIGGTYEGELNKDGSEIVGKWSQGGGSLPLTLRRDANIPGSNRPQEPKRPYPYQEEEVSYENKEAGVTLAATLTLPKGRGPFAAVLLITGSGPQDRDETLTGMNHKPFLVLSDYLTRQGIAVLRADDRGIGKSTGDFVKATSADFAGDALAGVAYLKSRKEINPKEIGLLGHSEGGLIAPMVATQTEDVAFIVLMAGTAVPGTEILSLQKELIQRAMGRSEEQIALGRATNTQVYAVVKEEKDPAAAEKKLRPIIAKELDGLSEVEKKALGDPSKLIEAQAKQLSTPWFRYFFMYDPKPTLEKVKCPVLAINGEKDLQVVPKQNLPVIEAALKAGGNKDFTVKELPGLNHLFQTSATGSPTEYGAIEETIAPVALQTIADWIRRHITRNL